jgi:hypothetical protein
MTYALRRNIATIRVRDMTDHTYTCPFCGHLYGVQSDEGSIDTPFISCKCEGGYMDLDSPIEILADADGPEHFRIERQEYDGAPCSHPMCEQLHQRFMDHGVHYTHVIEWVIVDVRTNERARADGINDSYDTKREAQKHLTDHLRRNA